MTEEKPMLKKENIIYDRNETGELIPKKVPLVNKVKGEIVYVKVTPLTRGERKEIAQKGLDEKGNTTIDMDKDIVLKHCFDPVFTEEELENTPLGFVENVSLTIWKESNLPIDVEKTKEKQKSFKENSEDVDEVFQNA